MTPTFDLGPLLSSLPALLLVIPAILGLIVLRAVILWRLDDKADEFRHECQSIDVHAWHDRKAA